LPLALQPYFSGLYAVCTHHPAGDVVNDYLHPEWAALRFTEGLPPLMSVGPGRLARQWPFTASGPTSRGVHFGLAHARVWRLGVFPAGWARYVDMPAHELADRTADGGNHPAFARFAPITGLIAGTEGGTEGDEGEIARLIVQHLLALTPRPLPNEAQLLACQAALRDPETSGVAELGGKAGISPRSLERLCRRYFGFTPKLLLRRQRFMRSLAQFMLDPKLTWAGALDGQYHDQAQFVREFRAFMDLTPRQYAALPHPILDRVMRQDVAYAAFPPSVLDPLPAIRPVPRAAATAARD